MSLTIRLLPLPKPPENRLARRTFEYQAHQEVLRAIREWQYSDCEFVMPEVHNNPKA